MTPLGLERDYIALGDIDRDKFELHLRNIFNRSFGETFVTTKLRISFPNCRCKLQEADLEALKASRA
jgi:hypothetical protein